ncbi:hypothetical protein XENOCAPTIV_001665 [Xenoophorus captivus]|uniref:Transposase Helix-turn-helix domain-containing protein n=1 Tax=Xenoophorus captivus TaxID=1517983 RepID=A0ABV0Q7E5_9TELE
MSSVFVCWLFKVLSQAKVFHCITKFFCLFVMRAVNTDINVSHHAPVPITKQVLMFLWYMANQNSFREISDKCDVPHSSAHRIILVVLNTICTMEPTFISWPDVCKTATSVAFHHICDLICNVSGAINVWHIRMQRPQI